MDFHAVFASRYPEQAGNVVASWRLADSLASMCHYNVIKGKLFYDAEGYRSVAECKRLYIALIHRKKLTERQIMLINNFFDILEESYTLTEGEPCMNPRFKDRELALEMYHVAPPVPFVGKLRQWSEVKD